MVHKCPVNSIQLTHNLKKNKKNKTRPNKVYNKPLHVVIFRCFPKRYLKHCLFTLLKKKEEKELYKGQKITQLLNIWLKGWQRAKVSKNIEHVHSKAPSRKALLKFSRISGTDPVSLPVHFSHMRSLRERGHEDCVTLRCQNGHAACHSLSAWSGLTFISNHASCSICGCRQQQVQTVYSAIVLLPCSQKTGDSAFSQHVSPDRGVTV